MVDRRAIEMFLRDFFERKGFDPTVANGEAFIGLARTRTASRTVKTEQKEFVIYSAEVEDKPETELLCLGVLADELATITSGQGGQP